MNLTIRKAVFEDKAQLLKLYKEVAKVKGGIIRQENEIDQSFIDDVLDKTINKGIIYVGVVEQDIVGAIHAFTPYMYAFQHMLVDLTIIVAPIHQGKGIGRKLFSNFLNVVETERTDILRIELYTRANNNKNIRFYESLGFVNEGRQEHKIFVSKGVFETPIHMAWFNKKFK